MKVGKLKKGNLKLFLQSFDNNKRFEKIQFSGEAPKLLNLIISERSDE